MANYDFSCLNDKEFESLSVDILSAHTGQHVERFRGGRDGGVDGRFFSANDEEVIIQCKHWIKSGLPALLRSLISTEADKVRKLNPSRYIFITSLELSRANKIKIKKIFSPFILNDDDILGNEDINIILSKNLSIEQKHYKLWLTSTNVLKIILDAAIVGRSSFKLEEIIEDSSRYVVTSSHNEALNKLEQLHSIIIKGVPGIGKTSLADQLCIYYSALGYELCYIENSLNEAESHYDDSRKQIFYFDDFLGRNFLLALDHHQDSHVVNFIRRVKRDPKKRFILTSRSNILNQGMRLSDLFEIEHINKNEYEISIYSLSDYDKAKILYNHIWFGQLEESYIDEIYRNKRYQAIIKHKNFNPRLISFITDFHRLNEITPENYWKYIKSTLDNPKGVWGNVFEIQLDDICRHIVIAVAIHGKKISETDLNGFFYRLKSTIQSIEDGKSFESTMRLLSGALLNRSITSKSEVAQYDLFNPSIADYVLSTYINDIDYIVQILSCLETTESIDNLHSVYSSGFARKITCKNLIEKSLLSSTNEFLAVRIDKYLIRLLSFASELLAPNEAMGRYIVKVIEKLSNPDSSSLSFHAFKCIDWAIELNLISRISTAFISKLEDHLRSHWLDHEEYCIISKIISHIEPSGGNLTNIFKKEFTDCYSDNFTNRAIEADVLPDIYNIEDCNFSKLEDLVTDDLSEIYIPFTSSEISNIGDNCDMDEIVQSNIDAASYEDQEYEEQREAAHEEWESESEIDDLFDRG